MEDVPEEKRLFPVAIDYRAQTNPDGIYVFLAKGQFLEDGFFPLTWKGLAKAVDECAWWLDSVLEGQNGESELTTVPYIGANDIRYTILLFAATKTRRKLLIPLVYNTVKAAVVLLNATKSSFVMASKGSEHYWDGARGMMKDLKMITVPEMDYFVHDSPVKHYPFDLSLEKALEEPCFVVQTSGTTGDPKPLVFSHRTVNYFVAAGRASTLDMPLMMVELLKDTYTPMVFPLSWAAGLGWCAFLKFAFDHIPIMPPSSAPHPMTAEYLVNFIKAAPRGQKNGVVTVPDVVRKLARNTEYLNCLKTYDWIGYAGAPLDDQTGDLVSQVTRVQSMMGQSETGLYHLLLSDPSDWKYRRFHPTLHGFFFEYFADDLYELCTRKQPNDGRPCFKMDPTIDVYHTKDLFRKVPGREDFWIIDGRVDDFVKLSSLSKFNAIKIETDVNRNPHIDSCVIAGDGRKRPFALVQLATESGKPRDELLDLIWPSFEDMNKRVSSEVEITRDLVLFTNPEMPMKKTAKGTVDRRTTLKMYDEQIMALYGAAGHDPLPNGATGGRK